MLDPTGLDAILLGNTITEWLLALLAATLVAVGVRAVSAVVLERVRRLARHTENDLDDLVANLLVRTKGVFILLLAVWTGSRVLTLPERVGDLVGGLLVVGLLLQIGWWAMAAVDYALGRYQKRQLEVDPGLATAVGAMGFVARVAVWVIVTLTIMGTLGIEITPLVASLGIGGIAVALALQNVLSDLFASLSIVLDKPFVIGDFIIVGELMGTVEHVGLKSTRVRSLSGEQLVFSNSDLLSSRIRNYKRMAERRAVFTVGVTYGTPSEKLRRIPEIIRKAVEDQDDTRFDRCHFKEYGASSLDFETVYFMLVPDFNAYMDVQQAINLAVYERFEAEDLEFAFPTRTLHVEGLGDGARAALDGASRGFQPAGPGDAS